MSTLTARRGIRAPRDSAEDDAVAAWPAAHRRSAAAYNGVDGGSTLYEHLVGVWERLTAHAVVECPVCGGSMEPAYSAHALPVGGCCCDCASALS